MSKYINKLSTEKLNKLRQTDFTVELTGSEIMTLIELAEEGLRNTPTKTTTESIYMLEPIKILKKALKK